MQLRRLLAAATVAGLSIAAASAAALHYPAAPQTVVTDRYFGTAVTDPYRSLENGDDPQTKVWASEETALARRFLHSQPSYAWFASRIAQLSSRSTQRFALQIVNGRFIYLRRTPPQAQPQLVARDGLGAPERVLFDPQTNLVSGRPPAIESVFVSHDGSKVAFGIQVGGSEEQTLRVVDAATGTLYTDTDPNVGWGGGAAVTWDGDNNGFIHTQIPPPGPQHFFSTQLYHHTLGTDYASDTYVFGKDFPKTAEVELRSSVDGTQTAVFVAAGDGVHDTVYLRSGNGDFTEVASPSDNIGSSGSTPAAFVGNTLMVVSTKRNGMGEIVAIPPGSTFASGTVVVPAGNAVIEGLTPVADGFITRDLAGGDGGARYFSAGGTFRARLPIPPISTVTALAGDPRGGPIIIGNSSYTVPQRWLRYEPASNQLVATGIEEKAPGNYAGVVVTRVLVPSLDGKARIPLEIARLHTTQLNSNAPTILTGYGAYGIVTRPRFLGSQLAWLERGGVSAQAMIRGGGEYGEAWHLAARLQTKTVSSDDMAACAQWLESHGYTSRAHLGIVGGSAGGFLMGLSLTRNPDLYRAVVGFVGIYDLLRVETTPNGVYNIPEFGTVKDPSQFSWMVKQSPYENVRPGVKYPAVLMVTGENDPRVTPWQSRKMVAKLQADDASPYPVLLIQNSGQGHGIGNSFQQEIQQQTETSTFFYSQLH